MWARSECYKTGRKKKQKASRWFGNLANQLRLVVYPVIYGVVYIPGGCLGFLPPTVGHDPPTSGLMKIRASLSRVYII